MKYEIRTYILRIYKYTTYTRIIQLFCILTSKIKNNNQNMKYHKINQASGSTFDTKPSRNRHKPCETVTL